VLLQLYLTKIGFFLSACALANIGEAIWLGCAIFSHPSYPTTCNVIAGLVLWHNNTFLAYSLIAKSYI
jgi:hypothetical protein